MFRATEACVFKSSSSIVDLCQMSVLLTHCEQQCEVYLNQNNAFFVFVSSYTVHFDCRCIRGIILKLVLQTALSGLFALSLRDV